MQQGCQGGLREAECWGRRPGPAWGPRALGGLPCPSQAAPFASPCALLPQGLCWCRSLSLSLWEAPRHIPDKPLPTLQISEEMSLPWRTPRLGPCHKASPCLTHGTLSCPSLKDGAASLLLQQAWLVHHLDPFIGMSPAPRCCVIC